MLGRKKIPTVNPVKEHENVMDESEDLLEEHVQILFATEFGADLGYCSQVIKVYLG